jgi:hypothetical protein
MVSSEAEDSDVEMQDAPIFARPERETEEENTPKPKKKAAFKRKGDDSGESDRDRESDNFQTPRALKKRVAKRAEFLAESDANSMDMSKTDPQTDGRTESESEDPHASVEAQTHQQNKGESRWMLPKFQVITDQVIVLQDQRVRKIKRRSERKWRKDDRNRQRYEPFQIVDCS